MEVPPGAASSSSNLVKYSEPPPAGGHVHRSLFAEGKGLPGGHEPEVRVTHPAQPFPCKLRKEPLRLFNWQLPTPPARSSNAARRANPARQHLIWEWQSLSHPSVRDAPILGRFGCLIFWV